MPSTRKVITVGADSYVKMLNCDVNYEWDNFICKGMWPNCTAAFFAGGDYLLMGFASGMLQTYHVNNKPEYAHKGVLQYLSLIHNRPYRQS